MQIGKGLFFIFFFIFTHFPNNQTEQYTFFIEMTDDHFLPKTSIFFSRKPNMNHQNPKRSEIEKRKTLGNITKFQDLKSEKERERGI